MTMRTFAAIALLALSTLATAAGVENDQELYQRQYQYAHIMMRLNGIDGDASPAELAKLKVARVKVTPQRAVQPDTRTFMLDAFADAAQQAIDTRRAKRALSRQWQINEDYPTHWSVSANPEAAADCARAIEHPLGQPLRIEMNRNGVAWLRVVAPSKGYWAFDTLISEFDTRLSVYRDCRDIGSVPRQSSDDNVGLGSIVGLDAKAAGQTWLIKLERKDGIGDLAIAKSVLAQSISGSVTHQVSGAGLSVLVGSKSTSTGYMNYVSSSQVDGSYSLPIYEPGEYLVRTAFVYFLNSNPPDYDVVPIAFPNAACVSVSVSDFELCNGVMTGIFVAEDAQVSEIDFALSPGVTVSGYVTDEESLGPVQNAIVDIWIDGDRDQTLSRERTDSLGRFRIRGLPSANWLIEYGHTRYQTERWDNVVCPTDGVTSSCAESAGVPLHTGESGTVSAHAALRQENYVRIRTTVSGAPPPNATVELFTPEGVSSYASSRFEAATGTIEIGPLASGEYRVAVNGTGAYSKVYGGVDCASSCNSEVLSGEIVTIPVAYGDELNIQLRALPTLSGRRIQQRSAPPQ